MSYQVVWNKCNVFSADGTVKTLERGETVPDSVDDVQKENLAIVGAVQFVGTTASDVVVDVVVVDSNNTPAVESGKKPSGMKPSGV